MYLPSLTQRRTLAIDGATWEVDAEAPLGHARRAELAPPTQARFQLERDALAPTFAAALDRARALARRPATLDGVAVTLRLDRGEVWYQDDDEQDGSFAFTAAPLAPLAWQCDCTDAALVAALQAAGRALEPLAIRADAIDVTERYYVFRVWQIGCLGALVDRHDARVVVMGSGLDEALWMWGAARGLTEPGTVTIAAAHDPDAWPPLRRALGLLAEDMPPIDVAIDWRAIAPLHAAGDRVAWSLR